MSNRSDSHKNFGVLLLDLIESVIKNDVDTMTKSADSIESMIESKDFSKKYEFFGILYVALAYDIANERFSAERLYRDLADCDALPDLRYLVESDTDSKNISKVFSHIGLRKFSEFDDVFSEIVSNLQNRKRLKNNIPEQIKDDYVVLFSVLSLLRDFLKAIEDIKPDEMKNILNTANKLYQEFKKFSPESWIELVADMYLELIRQISERTIISLDISEKMKGILLRRHINELWNPQKTAIKLDLLNNQNILYSSPPGTGKSFLAYMAAGNKKEKMQTLYLVPSKSLSAQVFNDLNQVLGEEYTIAVSDRDKTDDDDDMDQKDIVVATYEKMDALLKRNKIKLAKIQTVIVDEIQYLGDYTRGLTLELMLTKFMQHEDPIQIIGLSGLLYKENAEQLSKWMSSREMISQWKGIKIEESIFLDDKMYNKNGSVSNVKIPLKKPAKGYKHRKFIAAQFAKKAIQNNESLLISAIKRATVSELAYDLLEDINRPTILETNLITKLYEKRHKYQTVIDQIKLIEPEIPEFAQRLIDMLKSGVAYHHAGLPWKYRQIIETAIKDNSLDVVVATSTLDAGMNLPIKTVLFFNPQYSHNRRWKPIENRQYKNTAGRAGRPGFHRTGNVIVLSTTEAELRRYVKKFWRGNLEAIESALYEFVKESTYPTSILASHILGFASEHENTSLSSIKEYFQHTWFWRQSQSEIDSNKLLSRIEDSLELLKKYDFIDHTKDGGYFITYTGNIVNQSMMPSDFAFNVIKCIEHLFVTEYDKEDVINIVLILSGLSPDLRSHKKILEKIEIPEQIARLKETFQNIDGLSFDLADPDFSLRCASMSYYWINSFSMKQIIEHSKLNLYSDSAMIEENLIKDVHRALLSVRSVAESIKNNEENYNTAYAQKIFELIDNACKFCYEGTRQDVAGSLIRAGFNYSGRATALKLNDYLNMQQKELLLLSQDEFQEIFPDNKNTAKMLYDEIHKHEEYFKMGD